MRFALIMGALQDAWLFLKAGAPPPAWTRPENQFDLPQRDKRERSLRGTEWDHGTTIETNPALDRMGDASGKGVFRSSPYDKLGEELRHPSHYSKDDYLEPSPDGGVRRYRTSPKRRRRIEVTPRRPVAEGSSSVFDDDKKTTDEPDTNNLAEEYPTRGDIAGAAASDNVRRYKAGERNLPSSWEVADNWEDPRSQRLNE